MTVAEARSTPEATEAGLEFEELFRAEYSRLTSGLQLLTGSRTDAEDLAQDALARVYERWSRVRTMDSPAGYLYTVALNLARKRARRLRRAPVPPDPPGAADPEATAERRAAIRAALRSLSKEQREALVVVDWLGFPPADAAAVLGVSPESVRARLHRARSSLRSRFGGVDE
ncbi:MAG TPA: sigma-70 family RNA polymerase sigma factor [Actinomycetota bacterium]|nr:sigma-70 family RNA polymerase sigma factor [Actinomycetota bacterium]